MLLIFIHFFHLIIQFKLNFILKKDLNCYLIFINFHFMHLF